MWISNRSDTNLNFRFKKKEEGLYYPYSKNKGADQLRDYYEADLRLCAYAKCWFSHDAAPLIPMSELL